MVDKGTRIAIFILSMLTMRTKLYLCFFHFISFYDAPSVTDIRIKNLSVT